MVEQDYLDKAKSPTKFGSLKTTEFDFAPETLSNRSQNKNRPTNSGSRNQSADIKVNLTSARRLENLENYGLQ